MSHCRGPAPVLPPHGGGGGLRRAGGGGTTLSPTLALSLTPLTQSSSLWLPLCLHHRLSCSTLLPQTLPCSIPLPQTLPCSILLPQTMPCSIPLPHTLPCSTLLPQTLPCSILLSQTLPCSILLPPIPEGWGGTLTLPISKPPCSPLLLAIPGWGWVTLCPFRPRRINERGRNGAKNVRKARAPPSLPPAPATGRAHSWKGGGGQRSCGRRRSQRGCPQPSPPRRHEARATQAGCPWLGLWLTHPPPPPAPSPHIPVGGGGWSPGKSGREVTQP